MEIEWVGMVCIESNGMEWNGTEWSGTEWSGMEWNEAAWGGTVCMEWNGMGWNCLFKIDVRSSLRGAPGFPKSVQEAPRSIQIRCREHFEQQVGLPWPVWATIGTL